MNFEEYNVLGNIINDGWGKSTEDPGGAFKIISKITREERLSITCMMVVNLLNRNDMQKECKKASQRGTEYCIFARGIMFLRKPENDHFGSRPRNPSSLPR